MDILEKLRYDISWDIIDSGHALKCSNFHLILKIIRKLRSESFHAVLMIRLFCFFSNKSSMSFFKYYFSYRLKRRYSISVYDKLDIKGGLRLPHPYGIIFGYGTQIGSMVTIGQFVTLGGNMGFSKNNRSTPIIGDWSMICANSVIAGPIYIGRDVIIGACSLITCDVADHLVVSSVGKITERTKDGRFEDSIVYNKFYNFPSQTVKNFTF